MNRRERRKIMRDTTRKIMRDNGFTCSFGRVYEAIKGKLKEGLDQELHRREALTIRKA